MQQLKQLVAAAIILLMFTACGETAVVTPTPFPSAPATIAADTSRPIPVPITDLAANPAFYNNAYIQLSGQYQRLPKLVCGGRTYRSPATWGLVRSDFLARARGIESQLFTLAPKGLLVTANGYWRQWKGPVGCGKDAVAGTIWYLDVAEIVSPSPLVAASLTPAGSSGVLANLSPTPTNDSNPEATLVGTPPSPTLAATATGASATPTPSATFPGSEAINTSTPSTTPDGTEQENSTATPTTTSSPTSTSGTPNATTPSATPTQMPGPTATGSSGSNPTSTPTGGFSPTATPGGGTTTQVNMGLLDIGGEVFSVELLDQLERHSWTVELVDTDWLTVYTIGEPAMNLTITLRDPDGNLLVSRNDNGAGQVESFVEFPIAEDGDYQLQIESTSGSGGYYVVSAQDDFAFSAIFQGLLTYGSMQSATLPAITDNYWFFSPTPGDEVTITANSLNGDIFFYVYNANGDELDYVEQNGGSTTTTLNVTASGLYTIYLGDQNFEVADYTISLTKDN